MEFGNPVKPGPKPLFWIFLPALKGAGITVLRAREGPLPSRSSTAPASAPRWPRTLAGITAYQSCLQYPFTSVPLSGGAPGTRASRRCDRAGRWEPGDYSHCLYTNDITRVLYTFVLVRPGQQRGGGTPSALVLGNGEGRSLTAAPPLLGCAVRGSGSSPPAFLLPGDSDPQGHTKEVWASIFIPQHSKGSLKGENKDSVRSSHYPWAGGERNGKP